MTRIFTDQDIASLRDFVKKEILPNSKSRDETETFPVDVFKKLHELGWTRCFIPTELGGLGASTEDLICIFKEIAYASPGIATSMAGNMLALLPIFMFGRPELKKRIATEYQENFSLSSFCFTEPDHGSDVLRIGTFAKPVQGGYLLKGKKCFVTNANHASRFVVVAKTQQNPDSPTKSMSLFLVNANSVGVHQGSAYSKMGLRDSNTSEVFFDDVFVPKEHLIGNEGDGFSIACRSIQRSRIMLAASGMGLCERAAHLTEDYLSQRILYGKPLLSNHSITGALSQLYSEKEAITLLIEAAARSWDTGDLSFKHSSMAKLLSGQLTVKFASTCLELFGGWGCTKEYEIERIYRDAKFYEIMEGPSLVQLAILSKEFFNGSKNQQQKLKPAA